MSNKLNRKDSIGVGREAVKQLLVRTNEPDLPRRKAGVPPILSFVSRPGLPRFENAVLATINANGGDYDLISSMVIWRGYSGITKGDTDYLGGQQYLPEAGLSKSLSH